MEVFGFLSKLPRGFYKIRRERQSQNDLITNRFFK